MAVPPELDDMPLFAAMEEERQIKFLADRVRRRAAAATTARYDQTLRHPNTDETARGRSTLLDILEQRRARLDEWESAVSSELYFSQDRLVRLGRLLCVPVPKGAMELHYAAHRLFRGELLGHLDASDPARFDRALSILRGGNAKASSGAALRSVRSLVESRIKKLDVDDLEQPPRPNSRPRVEWIAADLTRRLTDEFGEAFDAPTERLAQSIAQHVRTGRPVINGIVADLVLAAWDRSQDDDGKEYRLRYAPPSGPKRRDALLQKLR